MKIVSPRSIEIIAEARAAMAGVVGRPGVEELARQVDALMPSHAAWEPSSAVWAWTTPSGLWRLWISLRDPGYTDMFTVEGPGGKWIIADPRFEHVRSMLIVLGAIEGGPADAYETV